MSRASGEGYRFFQRIAGLVGRHPRILVGVWMLLFAGALLANQVWRSEDVVSFSQAGILPRDTESAQAQDIVEEQFPGASANSSAIIVLVADNATDRYYREFVVDLHAAIVAASNLAPGESVDLALQTGGTITVDRRIELLRDPSGATVYAVEETVAYELAKGFNGPVWQQVGFTELCAQIYWGLPSVFVSVWRVTPEPASNETAYSAVADAMNATFPPSDILWPALSFEGFYQGWRASFSNGSLAGAPPDARAEAVIASTLPTFLDSMFAQSAFTPEVRLYQLGMLGTFRLSNFADPLTVRSYALPVFYAATPVARPAFFWELVNGTRANATDAELRGFARNLTLAYDPSLAPVVLPLDASRFFLSPDGRIVLMNYGFDRDEGYLDAEGRAPIAENVYVIRDLVARMRAAYGADAAVYVTGSAPASLDSELAIGGGAEFIVTILLVVILIGLYFRSAVSPGLPILTIAIAIMIANLFVYLTAVYLFAVDFTVTAVLQTVLLATGTDYSIFLVSRYRDERRDGKDKHAAVRNAVIWAGESVTTSGGAVLISFAALSLGSFPILKGMGLTMGFAVTVALGIALTFIPALLLLMGDRVFWPSGKRVAKPRSKDSLSATERYFRGAAIFSMKHAKAVLLAAILITLPATYLVLTDEPTFDFSEGAPVTESGQGLDAISGAFGYGFIYPTYVVVRFPDPVFLSGNASVPKMDAIQGLMDAILAREARVRSAEGPTNPQGTPVDYRNMSSLPEAERAELRAAMAPYIGRDDRTVRLFLVLEDRPFSREAIATIDRIGAIVSDVRGTDPELAGAQVLVGGVTAVLNDVRDNTNRDLQIMAVVVMIGLFLVLLFVLGSVLIPLRAILTILLSISWTLGLTIALFHVWRGLDLIFILPLALFVMAMGLGMDYDIFIITRVREEVARGASDRDAITEATTRTGGIISACGIVMAGAFATLMLNPSPFLQQIGFALAFAILLDSMVVRIYLVPAIMVLAGRYNWWAPGRLQRVRRDRPAESPKKP